MKKTLILGDIHGRWGEANDIIDQIDLSQIDQIIQVGDFGFWPTSLDPDPYHNSPPWVRHFEIPFMWVDGNHEQFEILNNRHLLKGPWKEFLNRYEYMPRGTVRDGILFIGGASSIDKYWRTNHVDWFMEEDISYKDKEAVLKNIEGKDIHTVISHEGPYEFNLENICPNRHDDANSRFLDIVLEEVKPKHWFFGHYHIGESGYYEPTKTNWRVVGQSGTKDYVVIDL